MEYAGALGTIIFDELCCLRDLTEAQVGRNQFAMDMAVDRLDGEVDHALERISTLEGKVADLEAGYTELLALGREQVETSSHAVLSSVGISKEICLITVGLTEANVATVLAGWLSK